MISEQKQNTFERNPEKESPKSTTSNSDELGSLQLISELDTRQCASEEVVP